MPEAEMKFTRLNSRGENSSRTSKLPAGGVVLLVLVGLLAAALIVVCSLAVDKAQSNQTIRTLKEENEALRKNLSGLTCLKREAGWEPHGGSCYYFSSSKSSWTDSRDFCKQSGGHLVKIDSREEQMFLESRLKGLMEEDEDKFWIGLTDSGEEDEWLWVDGSPLNESLNFWGYGQPDDLGVYNLPGADCARMGQKDAAHDLKCWYDRGCDYPQKSICEKSAAGV